MAGREPWRTVAVRKTVAGDRAVRGAVRGAVRQETEPCGCWAVRGSPRHEPNRGGSVRSVRTATVCGTVVNTSYGWVSILLNGLMKIFDDLTCNNFVRAGRLDKDDR